MSEWYVRTVHTLITRSSKPERPTLALTLVGKKKNKKKGMMAVGGEPPTAFKQFPDP